MSFFGLGTIRVLIIALLKNRVHVKHHKVLEEHPLLQVV